MCFYKDCFICSVPYIIICEDYIFHLDHQPQLGEALTEDYIVTYNNEEYLICPDCIENDE